MNSYNNQNELAFFKSVLVKDAVIHSTEEVLDWIYNQNKQIRTSVTQIPLVDMKRWKFDDMSGNIHHDTGKFFSIEGIRVKTNFGKVTIWEQPIINQPEIGFLGILTKKISGVLYFLMQAKIEPGNLNCVQLSPTLQATKSNYTKVHQGKSPLFLDYFNGKKQVITLLDQLQSEQGARFLMKRNRNIIVQVPEQEQIEPPDNFRWLTLGQIKELLKHDNIVNMDTRTVISAIPFGSYNSDTLTFFSEVANVNKLNLRLLNSILNNEMQLHSLDQIISWVTKLKTKYSLEVTQIPLNTVSKWNYNGISIVHDQAKYFEVIGVHVEIEKREVVSWHQPMIKPIQEGIIAFIAKNINGVYHFLVQAKVEAGNFDILELAPTVQCLTGNYRVGENEYMVPFINEVLNAPREKILYSTRQSEEGGRFYREQNINRIVEVSNDFPVEVPENFCWMTLNQLLTFLKFNNYLNIASRSLISAISF